MKNVLVTGGAGFLGSNLCKGLLERGDNVICVDNLYTGRLENIQDFVNHKRFRFIKHDIRESLEIKDKVDIIFNLASPASPPAYKARPIFTTTTCVQGALSCVEIARKNNAILFHTSTSEIYGDPEVVPQSESYNGSVNPIGERSCYDEGKRCAESILFDSKRLYDINLKVVRIFNTYGPNMRPDDGRVVTNFIIQALKGDDITIYGNGKQTRCLCYVDDQIDAWMEFIEKDKDLTGPINIGTQEEISVLEFAELIKRITKSKSKIVFLKATKDDPQRRLPDISLAKKELGWEPKTSLEEGLAKTINYLRRYLSACDI